MPKLAELEKSGQSVWFDFIRRSLITSGQLVDELIGPNTVNTIPPATLDSFMDHGRVAETLTKDWEEAHRQIEKLKE